MTVLDGPRGHRHRAQANTDLQWKALGSLSSPRHGPRPPGWILAGTGSIPTVEVCPVHGCVEAGCRGGLGYGQGESGVRVFIKHGGLVQPPERGISKPPIPDSVKISEKGFLWLYPLLPSS